MGKDNSPKRPPHISRTYHYLIFFVLCFISDVLNVSGVKTVETKIFFLDILKKKKQLVVANAIGLLQGINKKEPISIPSLFNQLKTSQGSMILNAERGLD